MFLIRLFPFTGSCSNQTWAQEGETVQQRKSCQDCNAGKSTIDRDAEGVDRKSKGSMTQRREKQIFQGTAST